jgi:hypothetical protein
VYNAKKTKPTFATGTVFLVGRSHKKSEHHMAVFCRSKKTPSGFTFQAFRLHDKRLFVKVETMSHHLPVWRTQFHVTHLNRHLDLMQSRAVLCSLYWKITAALKVFHRR